MSEEQTAFEFLKEHWGEIAYVDVTFTWSSFVLQELEGWHVEDDGDTYPSVSAQFYVAAIDEEYSFSGTPEEALGFFESYDVWDGRLDCSDIKGGILFKEYNSDVEEYKEPGDFDPSEFYREIHPQGLVYFRRDSWVHACGRAKFARDDPEDEQEE